MSFSDWVYYSSVGYVALVLALYCLSLFVPQAGFLARALVAYIAVIVCALYGVFVSIYLRATTGHAQSAQWAVARAFHYTMFLTTGVRFEVRDPKNILGTTRPAVFIGNHQTELDVLMLGAMFPKNCSVTAKASLKKVPFLGWFMSLAGSVFLDRKNSKDSRQVMSGAAKEMKEMQQSVYMFPEGTRSYSKEPELLPFKKGAFHLAVQAQVPIVPCVVANYSHILWMRGMKFKAGTIPIKVLDPIPTKGLTVEDVNELTRSTRELMLKELILLTAEARGSPIPTPIESAVDGRAATATGVEVKPQL
ncbi:1-acylglycerol-3-phosphate O-acyltransferase [Coniochaeta pulveracea]|uniref:1-acyl-sn-glycerol-3-phosphate acyltransferase n=1 Tax=Coniochaeta pulveracea TaxID=177199 RepID=A0A420XZD0_9PEZI|nr:1-acylglycerol-3-phosphate O-acyltransferase [Coniochaeta pulveracea]